MLGTVDAAARRDIGKQRFALQSICSAKQCGAIGLLVVAFLESKPVLWMPARLLQAVLRDNALAGATTSEKWFAHEGPYAWGPQLMPGALTMTGLYQACFPLCQSPIKIWQLYSIRTSSMILRTMIAPRSSGSCSGFKMHSETLRVVS